MGNGGRPILNTFLLPCRLRARRRGGGHALLGWGILRLVGMVQRGIRGLFRNL